MWASFDLQHTSIYFRYTWQWSRFWNPCYTDSCQNLQRQLLLKSESLREKLIVCFSILSSVSSPMTGLNITWRALMKGWSENPLTLIFIIYSNLCLFGFRLLLLAAFTPVWNDVVKGWRDESIANPTEEGFCGFLPFWGKTAQRHHFISQ